MTENLYPKYCFLESSSDEGWCVKHRIWVEPNECKQLETCEYRFQNTEAYREMGKQI